MIVFLDKLAGPEVGPLPRRWIKGAEHHPSIATPHAAEKKNAISKKRPRIVEPGPGAIRGEGDEVALGQGASKTGAKIQGGTDESQHALHRVLGRRLRLL